MTADCDFVGIRFEWRGTALQPWARRGLDCAGLTNYYLSDRGIELLPMQLIDSDGWSQDDMPKDYILQKARGSDLVAESDNAGRATMIIYEGFGSRMCLAPISDSGRMALVFLADMRSHWMLIGDLDNVTYWRLR